MAPMRIAPILVALVALLLLPAAASAGGRAEVQGDQLVVTGTEGDDSFMVGYHSLWPNEIVIEGMGSSAAEVQAKGPAEAGPGCSLEDRNTGSPPRIYCQSSGIRTIVANMGSGDDRFATSIGAGTADRGYDKRVDMGAGDDSVELIDHAGGSYALGDGDDEITGSRRLDTSVTGGAGNDDLWCKGKNASTNDKAELVADGGAGKDRICGGRADDRLTGGAGNDKVYAGEGDDRINGSAGDDILEGEDDADTITGGKGEDEVDGGSGKDSIKVRDGEVDDVACGSKKDTVIADTEDDLNRCEVVSRR